MTISGKPAIDLFGRIDEELETIIRNHRPIAWTLIRNNRKIRDLLKKIWVITLTPNISEISELRHLILRLSKQHC